MNCRSPETSYRSIHLTAFLSAISSMLHSDTDTIDEGDPVFLNCIRIPIYIPNPRTCAMRTEQTSNGIVDFCGGCVVTACTPSPRFPSITEPVGYSNTYVHFLFPPSFGIVDFVRKTIEDFLPLCRLWMRPDPRDFWVLVAFFEDPPSMSISVVC